MRWVNLILMLGVCTIAEAQERAFETLDVYASGVVNVHENFLHEYWTPGRGAQLVVTTPFYAGAAFVGGSFHRYATRDASVPAFDALYVFVGWEVAWRPVPRLRGSLGGRLGNYRMAFDDPGAIATGVRNESELSVAAHARLQVYLTRRLALNASATYQKVYTFLRLKLPYAGVGLSYTWTTPGWLRRGLR